MGRQDREGSGREDGRRKERGGERGDRRLNFFSEHAGRPGLEIALLQSAARAFTSENLHSCDFN